MKKPEEYLNEYGIADQKLYNKQMYLYTFVCEAIDDAKKDSYNQALLDVINNVKTKYVPPHINSDYVSIDGCTVVDEQSILKLRRN